MASKNLKAFIILLIMDLLFGDVITGMGVRASTVMAANTTVHSVEITTVTSKISTSVLTGTHQASANLPKPYPVSHCMVFTEDSDPTTVCLKPFIGGPASIHIATTPFGDVTTTTTSTVGTTITIYLSESAQPTITKTAANNFSLITTVFSGSAATSAITTAHTHTHTSGSGYSKPNPFKSIIGIGKHIVELTNGVHAFYSGIYPKFALKVAEHIVYVRRSAVEEAVGWLKRLLSG
ncbi:hypothetical protein F5884DRAFT_855330 [Xylogone sp. PMI_703]|nr:hypothetical protein F5884DRAFT_855330 [Xylogone sp. PMI_703]